MNDAQSDIRQKAGATLFSRFACGVYPFIRLPKTTQMVLNSFSGRDVTAEKVSKILKNNPAVEQFLLQVIESFGKRSDTPSLEASLVLIGMQNSRNLIVVHQLLRSAGMAMEWSAEGKLKTVSSQFLKYAIKTEENVAGAAGHQSGGVHTDFAFSAGIFFDVFVLLARRPEYRERKNKLIAYIDEIYNQSLKAADIAIEVMKVIPEFNYRRFIFAGCLLREIGKIVFAFSEPSYLEFAELVARKSLSRPLVQFAELKKFGLHHSTLGGAVCYSYSPFSILARAVLYQDDLLLLKDWKKNTYSLAAAMSLCSNIAVQFKKGGKMDESIFSSFSSGAGTELLDLKIDRNLLLKQLAKMK